jgi:hypothetical protein
MCAPLPNRVIYRRGGAAHAFVRRRRRARPNPGWWRTAGRRSRSSRASGRTILDGRHQAGHKDRLTTEAPVSEAEVLDYLRKQFSRVHAKLDRHAEDMREIKQRLTPVEHQIAQVVATEANHYVSLSDRLDRLVDRVERVERRLDFVPA